MKKFIKLGVALTFCVNCAVAQAPSWQWAKAVVGNNANNELRTLATDSSGNVYAAGYYSSGSLIFSESAYLENNGGQDAFIVKYDASGEVIWAKNIGATGEERIYAITVDGNDNLYVAGEFASPNLTLGATTLTNTGNQDVFIAKFDADGNAIWAKSASGSLYDYGMTITADISGNVFVAGSFFSSSLTFGSLVLNATGAPHDVFLVKFNSSGNVLWGKSAGGNGYDDIVSVATDSAGNVFATGSFYSTNITFGTTVLTNTNEYRDLFVVKYDAAGNTLWAKKAGGTNYDTPRCIKTDSNGNLYLVGHFSSPSIIFGGTSLLNSGTQGDIFLTKYSADGNVLWAKKATGSNNDFATSVSVDSHNDVYITGGFSSSLLTFGTLPGIVTTDTDIFVAKYDSGGNAIWAKQSGGSGYDNALFAAIDNTDHLIICGNSQSTQNVFDGITLLSSGEGNSYVAKMDLNTLATVEFNSTGISAFPNPVGNILNMSISGGAFSDDYSVCDMNGRVILSGKFPSSDAIDVSKLQSGMYVIKLDSNKTFKFIKK